MVYTLLAFLYVYTLFLQSYRKPTVYNLVHNGGLRPTFNIQEKMYVYIEIYIDSSLIVLEVMPKAGQVVKGHPPEPCSRINEVLKKKNLTWPIHSVRLVSFFYFPLKVVGSLRFSRHKRKVK